MTGARRAALTALAATVALVSGCATPARNPPQFKAKAENAVQTAQGEVSTGLIVVHQAQQRKILNTDADRVVSSSESAVSSISESFTSVQPPDDASSDEIRDAVSNVLSQAQDALADARIAIRRSDRGKLDASAKELRSAAEALTNAESKLR
jgi:hypothetical protein